MQAPTKARMAHKKRSRSARSVIALWVCLMSGAFSILREGLVLFVPTFADPTRVFWACSNICFVISGWVVIHQKVMRIRELEDRIPERYARMVEHAVADNESQSIKLLRHIKLIGSLALGVASAPNLPAGMDHSETLKSLKLLKAEGIVYDEPLQIDTSSPLAMMRAPAIWRISPGIEPFLDEILCEYE